MNHHCSRHAEGSMVRELVQGCGG